MTLLSLWPSGLGQECQTLCILPYLTLTAFLPGISIWKWENWGYLRFCILHKFTFKAEQSFLKRVPTWIFTTSILPSDPKPSNSVLSRYHSHQYPLFLRENIQEGPFKSHRNSTPSSTLVSSSHSKTSSGSSQPLPFIFFESLTIFLAVLAHLWPNAFSLELIYDKMRIFKRHFSQKLREHNNFFFLNYETLEINEFTEDWFLLLMELRSFHWWSWLAQFTWHSIPIPILGLNPVSVVCSTATTETHCLESLVWCHQ